MAENYDLSHLQVTTQRSINLTVLSRICSALNCQPGDLLYYVPDNETPKSIHLSKSKTVKKKGEK
jgi:DNA-binding Xre family transcriptional regulator